MSLWPPPSSNEDRNNTHIRIDAGRWLPIGADKRADDSLNEAWVSEASLPPVLGKIITRAAADIRQAVFFRGYAF